MPAKGKNEMTLSSTFRGSTKYFFYDVKMRDGSTVTVKTNLSEEDLVRYFPAEVNRLAWLRTAALQSTMPRKPIR